MPEVVGLVVKTVNSLERKQPEGGTSNEKGEHREIYTQERVEATSHL